VKREASANADLGKGKRMDTLLHNYTLARSPRSARPAPRVKREASQSAELGKGFRMARLMHEIQAITPSPRPVPRAIGNAAKKNLWKGVVGSVGACLKQAGRRSFVFLPGEQARRFSNPRVM
jgi:hypothetical protein